MAKRRVVITGAAGYVVQRMWSELSQRWDVVPIDVRARARKRPGPGGRRPHPSQSGRVPSAFPRRRRRHPLRIRDAPPGSTPPPGRTTAMPSSGRSTRTWPLRTTSTARPWRKASVASWWPAPTTRPTTTSGSSGPDEVDMVTPEMPPRSDNWYGWAKAAYELLGFVFATGEVDGRKLEVVQWRIGGPRDDDIDHVKPGDIKVMHRALGAYLSRRDQVQQAIRMVETESITDEHGVPFLIVYGISGNTHRFWSLASRRARRSATPRRTTARSTSPTRSQRSPGPRTSRIERPGTYASGRVAVVGAEVEHHHLRDARHRDAGPGHQHHQRRPAAHAGLAVHERRGDLVGHHVVPGGQRHCHSRDGLAHRRPRPPPSLPDLHDPVHRQLVPVRPRAEPPFPRRDARAARAGRRAGGADGAGHHVGDLPAAPARARDGRLGHRHHDGADPGTHAGRLDLRQLVVALDLLREPADRRPRVLHGRLVPVRLAVSAQADLGGLAGARAHGAGIRHAPAHARSGRAGRLVRFLVHRRARGGGRLRDRRLPDSRAHREGADPEPRRLQRSQLRGRIRGHDHGGLRLLLRAPSSSRSTRRS